jgi:hypothetical protein
VSLLSPKLRRRSFPLYWYAIVSIALVLLLSLPISRDYLGLRGYSHMYASADNAAIAVLSEINPTSIAEDREYGGKICQREGSDLEDYFYTIPARGEATHLPTMASGLCPLRSRVVGDYHTHGAYRPKFDNENFSDRKGDRPNDKGGNEDGWPPFYGKNIGYLGTPSGRIKRYDPWQKQVFVLQSIASGEIEGSPVWLLQVEE